MCAFSKAHTCIVFACRRQSGYLAVPPVCMRSKQGPSIPFTGLSRLRSSLRAGDKSGPCGACNHHSLTVQCATPCVLAFTAQ